MGSRIGSLIRPSERASERSLRSFPRTGRRFEIRKVSGQGRIRNRVSLDVGRIDMSSCALVPGEPEQFIGDQLAANRSAKLAAQQRVGGGWVDEGEISTRGIEIPVTVKFKKIAVKLIRAGFRHGIHDPARMEAVARRQRASFTAELLESVGEGIGHIHVGEGVVEISAVQQIIGSVGLAARYGNGDRTIEAFASRLIAAGSSGRSSRINY